MIHGCQAFFVHVGPGLACTGDNQERAQHTICMEKFFGIIRRTNLRRGSNRWVAGVCSGLAAQLGVSPTFARIVFLLLAVFPGPAVTFYLWAWLLLPDASGKIILESWLAERPPT